LEDKEALGRAFWTLMHNTVLSFHDPPTSKEREDFESFLASMAEIYPCETCRRGFEWVRSNPPNFESKKRLVEWSCQFHNSVNAHLNKPLENCQLYAEKSLGRGRGRKECPVCVRVESAVGRQKVESEGEGRRVEKFYSFCQIIA
jgi:hypothetical protein